MNADWHVKNRMPKNPTLSQRLAWHIIHAKKCTCREIPQSIQTILDTKLVNLKNDPATLAELQKLSVENATAEIDKLLFTK